MKKTDKKLVILAIIAALLSYLQLNGYQNYIIFVASLLLVFVTTMYNPAASLGVFMVLSYTMKLYDEWAFLIIVLSFGLFLKTIVSISDTIKTNVFIPIFILLTSSIISFSIYLTSLNTYVLLLCNIIVFFSIYQLYAKKQEENYLTILEFQLLLASLIYSFFSILASSDTATRLRILGTGNVRDLANIIGLFIVIAILNLNEGSLFKRVVRLFFIFLQSLVLIMTGSRGVFYSVIIVAALLFLFENKKKRHLVVSGGALVTLAEFAPQVLPSSFNISRLFELDNTARFRIWSMIVKGTKPFEWFIGTGLNSIYFKYRWYAHSVFLDCVISLGIPALIALIALMTIVYLDSKKRKNISQIIMLIFTIVVFSTHGHVFNTNFWIFLTLSVLPLGSTRNYLTKDISNETKQIN